MAQQFTNQATLSYNGVVTNSNIVVGEIQETLSATKTALVNNYTAGDSVTYIISIVNNGTTNFTGLSLSDDLGGYAFNTTTLYPLTYVNGSANYFVNGVEQTGLTVEEGPPLVIGGINVPAGGNATIIYETTVNNYAPLAVGSTVNNTATVTGTGLTAPLTAEEVITADTAPALTISKSMNPSTVAENERITYTFIIQNAGNSEAIAADNISVTDTFDPILNNITVTFNGATWSTPVNYTYNTATGTFATVPGQITVPQATYTQDTTTGAWTVTPGVSVLTVSGTI